MWGFDGEHTNHSPWLAARATLGVGNRADLLIDGNTLHDPLTGCGELRPAEGVAVAVPDRAAGLHVDCPPWLHAGEVHGREEGVTHDTNDGPELTP